MTTPPPIIYGFFSNYDNIITYLTTLILCLRGKKQLAHRPSTCRTGPNGEKLLNIGTKIRCEYVITECERKNMVIGRNNSLAVSSVERYLDK